MLGKNYPLFFHLFLLFHYYFTRCAGAFYNVCNSEQKQFYIINIFIILKFHIHKNNLFFIFLIDMQ